MDIVKEVSEEAIAAGRLQYAVFHGSKPHYEVVRAELIESLGYDRFFKVQSRVHRKVLASSV